MARTKEQIENDIAVEVALLLNEVEEDLGIDLSPEEEADIIDDLLGADDEEAPEES